MRGFVGGFECCADVVQATPEARVIGAIHDEAATLESAHVEGNEGDDHSSGGTEMAAAVEVVGGICTGARALCG